jgi:acyl carrier protein
MTTRSADAILADLAEVMRQAFPDRDVFEPVTSDTRVFADLGLASIDVVVLGERLEAFYGRRLPYGPFLAELRNTGADDLRLGDLVGFLQRNTGGP